MASVIENHIEDEAEEDLVLLEPITWKELLIASTIHYIFLLHFKYKTLEHLNALRKVRDGIHLNLIFKKKQTTTYLCFLICPSNICNFRELLIYNIDRI